MDMPKILARIEAELDRQNLKAATVSRRATNSSDTIRNWRRRVEAGEKPGASMDNLEAIAIDLDVPFDWLIGNGPDDLEAYRNEAGIRDRITAIVRALPSSLQPVALKQLSALVPEQAPELEAASPPADD
jgi:transcriptional regulator with XRE-family HTH domain